MFHSIVQLYWHEHSLMIDTTDPDKISPSIDYTMGEVGGGGGGGGGGGNYYCATHPNNLIKKLKEKH